MALFFDQDWFDARLREAALSLADVASALRLPEAAVREIWKDQRELGQGDVAALARLLGASPEEVVLHAGVATPLPQAKLPASAGSAAPAGLADVIQRLDELSARFTKLERAIADLQSLVIATRSGGPKGD
ncbi:MAG: helix-turn-helix transcriptional regulator [Parvibaculaceae bacterium]|nr:helix-turn-helix transcriptional regulator [Parvibaculaceae bacterium]